MPKIVELWNQHIAVQQGREVDTQTNEQVDNWTMIFTDRIYGDVTKITFREDARDAIISGLRGLVVADRIPSGI